MWSLFIVSAVDLVSSFESIGWSNFLHVSLVILQIVAFIL